MHTFSLNLRYFPFSLNWFYLWTCIVRWISFLHAFYIRDCSTKTSFNQDSDYICTLFFMFSSILKSACLLSLPEFWKTYKEDIYEQTSATPVTFKNLKWLLWRIKLDMCLQKTDAPGGNKVKIWQNRSMQRNQPWHTPSPYTALNVGSIENNMAVVSLCLYFSCQLFNCCIFNCCSFQAGWYNCLNIPTTVNVLLQ